VSNLLPSEAALIQHDIQQLLDAGNGCLTLTAITPASSPALVAAVVAGDPESKLALAAADMALRQIEQRSRDRPLPCLLCDDGTLWRGEVPAAIIVLLPSNVEPVTAAGFAVCTRCAKSHTTTELAHAAVVKLRAGWMPDLRLLPPMAAAGHA
jgi:hypothetical protein